MIIIKLKPSTLISILIMARHIEVAFLNTITDSRNTSKSCREKNRLIETEKGDLYILIDAVHGQKLTLQCHYCNENDDQRPKIWYIVKDLSNKIPQEVQLDMNNNATRQKIHVNEEHSLIINNFEINNTGLYYCSRLEQQEQDEKYNYLVDLIFEAKDSNESKAEESGNLTVWDKYYEDYFVPINTLFNQSNGVEFKQVRDEWHIEMVMVTHWRPWGACEVCGRPQNMGIRQRIGLCRIKLTHQSIFEPTNSTSDMHFISNANAVSCYSQLLSRILPGISNMTRIIPNFLLTENCEGTCNPDSEGSGRGWKAGKSSAFKYRKTVVLLEDDHLTVVCPESSLDNEIKWKQNGKELEAGQSVVPPNPEDEPRIIVTTFNTLYLIGVKESEEGNYTCEVDSIRMQQLVVFVVSKAKILTQSFIRYMMYLAFILSLTLPCYCGGVVIACSKRRSFKTYIELKEMEEGAEKYRLYDN